MAVSAVSPLKVLEATVMNMLQHYPFHAAVLMQTYRRYNADLVQAYACVRQEGMLLYLEIAPAFLALPSEERLTVLLHELEHVFLRHLARGKGREARLWGVVTDALINTRLRDHCRLPPGSITLERIREELPEEVRDRWPNGVERWSPEELYDWLKARGVQPEWAECGYMEREAASEAQPVDAVMRDALQRAKRWVQGMGRGEGGWEEVIRQWGGEGGLSWQHIIDQFIASATVTERIATWLKVNRRYEGWRGWRLERQPMLLVAVDTSGSIANQDLVQFWGYLHQIWQTRAAVWVVQCDTQIRSVERLTAQYPRVAKGRGGTEFGPVFRWAMDPLAAPHVLRPQRFDGLIYLTDGYHADKLPNPLPLMTLWGVTKGGRIPERGRFFWLPEPI